MKNKQNGRKLCSKNVKRIKKIIITIDSMRLTSDFDTLSFSLTNAASVSALCLPSCAASRATSICFNCAFASPNFIMLSITSLHSTKTLNIRKKHKKWWSSLQFVKPKLSKWNYSHTFVKLQTSQVYLQNMTRQGCLWSRTSKMTIHLPTDPYSVELLAILLVLVLPSLCGSFLPIISPSVTQCFHKTLSVFLLLELQPPNWCESIK